MRKRRIPPRVLVAVGVCVAGGAFGAALALSGGAAGGGKPVAGDVFGVFASGAPASVEPRLASLADQVGVDASDKTHFRVLATGLGQFNSRLVAFPARGGQNVCYSLLGASQYDPGMDYCYQPRGDNLPAGLAGERFSVVALQAHIDGVYHTQVFGVAENTVKSIRVNVAGNWVPLSIVRNGFYLDLPGTALENVGVVEATLANGTTQIHDIQTGE